MSTLVNSIKVMENSDKKCLELIEKISNKKYLNDEIKEIIKNKYSKNDNILSIIKLKRITKYKKEKLIELLREQLKKEDKSVIAPYCALAQYGATSFEREVQTSLSSLANDDSCMNHHLQANTYANMPARLHMCSEYPKIKLYEDNLFNIIPNDVNFNIISYMDEKSLYNLSRMKIEILNENWNEYWKQMYEYKYGKIKREINIILWSKLFIHRINSICIECNKRNTDIEIFYNINICIKCRKLYKYFKMITMTTAKNEYYLTPNDFKNLKCITFPNPYYKNGSDKRLYLKVGVYNYALGKCNNNEEEFNKKKEKSEKRKENIKENKKKKINEIYELCINTCNNRNNNSINSSFFINNTCRHRFKSNFNK